MHVHLLKDQIVANVNVAAFCFHTGDFLLYRRTRVLSCKEEEEDGDHFLETN